MALHTNLRDLDTSNVPDHVVNAVAVGSMVIGMREITEATIDEWCTRAYMAQTVHEPWIMTQEGDIMLTRADVVPLMGFRANITPVSAAKFNAQMIAALRTKARGK